MANTVTTTTNMYVWIAPTFLYYFSTYDRSNLFHTIGMLRFSTDYFVLSEAIFCAICKPSNPVYLKRCTALFTKLQPGLSLRLVLLHYINKALARTTNLYQILRHEAYFMKASCMLGGRLSKVRSSWRKCLSNTHVESYRNIAVDASCTTAKRSIGLWHSPRHFPYE